MQKKLSKAGKAAETSEHQWRESWNGSDDSALRCMETEKPTCSLSTVGGDETSTRAARSSYEDDTDRTATAGMHELSEGLTEFLLKKIVELHSYVQPESIVAGQRKDQASRLGERHETVCPDRSLEAA